QLAFGEEFGAEHEVFQQFAAVQVEGGGQTHFVLAAVGPDVLEEEPVGQLYEGFLGSTLGIPGAFAQGIHDGGEIDLVGAAGGAGLAGGAVPDASAGQHPLVLAELQQPDDPV